MDELNKMISQVMNNPDSMRQIQEMAASLGLGGNQSQQPQPPAPSGGMPDLSSLAALLGGSAQQSQPPASSGGMPDLSALAALLGGSAQQSQPSAPSGNMPDLSAISGILSGLSNGAPKGTDNATPNLSALTALLNGQNAPSAEKGGILPNIDISTIMKLSGALSSLQQNRANVDLLLALKPRLKGERAKKIDDAIRIMQLIQFLPLIKESGLFGEMDSILGGLTGGLGGLLGNVGNGIGELLGGSNRR